MMVRSLESVIESYLLLSFALIESNSTVNELRCDDVWYRALPFGIFNSVDDAMDLAFIDRTVFAIDASINESNSDENKLRFDDDWYRVLSLGRREW